MQARCPSSNISANTEASLNLSFIKLKARADLCLPTQTGGTYLSLIGGSYNKPVIFYRRWLLLSEFYIIIFARKSGPRSSRLMCKTLLFVTTFDARGRLAVRND